MEREFDIDPVGPVATPPFDMPEPYTIYNSTSRTRPTDVWVGTPAYSGWLSLAYVRSMQVTRTLFEQMQVGLHFNIKPGDGLVSRARAEIVADFLLQVLEPEPGTVPPTHLLFIDSDIGWDPGDVIRLVKTRKPVVCGVYRKRQIKPEFPITLLDGGLIPTEETEGGTVGRLRHAPGGFVMFTAEALLELVAAYPERRCQLTDGGWFAPANRHGYDLFPEPIDNRGVKLSEDYGICHLWEQIGGEVWCLPDINLLHKGEAGFSGTLGQYLAPVAGMENMLGVRRHV